MSSIKNSTYITYSRTLRMVSKELSLTHLETDLENILTIETLVKYLHEKPLSTRKAVIYSLIYFAKEGGCSKEYIESLEHIGKDIQKKIPVKEDKGETREDLEPKMEEYRAIYNLSVEFFNKTVRKDWFVVVYSLYPLIDSTFPAGRNDLPSLVIGKQPEGNYYDLKTRMVYLRDHKSDKHVGVVKYKVPVGLNKMIRKYMKHYSLKAGDKLINITKSQVYKILSGAGLSIREIRNFQVKYYEGEEYRKLVESAKKRGHTVDVASRFYAV